MEISKTLQTDSITPICNASPDVRSPASMPMKPPRKIEGQARDGDRSRPARTIAFTGQTAGMPMVAATTVWDSQAQQNTGRHVPSARRASEVRFEERAKFSTLQAEWKSFGRPSTQSVSMS